MTADPWLYLTEHWPDVPVRIRFLPGGLWGRTDWPMEGPPQISLHATLGPIARQVCLWHEVGHLELDTTEEDPVVEWTAKLLLPDVGEVGRILALHDVRKAAGLLAVTRRVLLDRLSCLAPDEEERLAVVMAHASQGCASPRSPWSPSSPPALPRTPRRPLPQPTRRRRPRPPRSW